MRQGTIHREGSFRFTVPTDDHEPSHVHVFGDGEAKIDLRSVTVIWSVRMKKSDLRKILRVVEVHRARMLAQWEMIHG